MMKPIINDNQYQSMSINRLKLKIDVQLHDDLKLIKSIHKPVFTPIDNYFNKSTSSTVVTGMSYEA